MPVQHLHTSTGVALYDSDEVSENQLADVLERGLVASSVPLPGAAGREGVRVLELSGNMCVWRHYRRGGWPGRFVRDAYVWLGAERSRSFREWRLLQQARALGLPVPIPVAALVHQSGAIYRADIVTQLIPDSTSLGGRLQAAPVPLELWRSVGACIRRFHAHGFHHADLNVHNILLDAADQVHLIDFDRGEIRAPGDWTERNWRRLRRSLDKVSRTLPAGRFGEEQWAALRGAA